VSRGLFVTAFGFALTAAVLLYFFRGGRGGPAPLKILTWSQYLPSGFVDRFTAETGIPVQVSVFSSNEELFAKLRAGVTGYDILQPSDYLVDRMIRLGMLAPLDRAQIPNSRHLAAHLFHVPYDPGLQFSMPFLEGSTGLIVNRSRIKIPEREIGWGMLFESKDPRGTFLMDDMREVFAAALLWKGKNPNDLDEAGTQLAAQVLRDARENFVSFNSEPVAIVQRMEITVAHAFSYQGAEAERLRPHLRYVLPREGAVHWVDTMVVPVTSKRRNDAYRFINFVLDRTNNEYLRSLNGFPTVLTPAPDGRGRLYLRDLSPENFLLLGRAWTEAKAG
jgi:spermidine/putrescine transport system substrate-binding protein